MVNRRAAWLAWTICALVVGLALAGVALTLAANHPAQKDRRP